MSRLSDLIKGADEMTIEELQERLRHVRADRVVRKARKTTSKPKRREAGNQLKDMLSKMSPAEIAELARNLK